MLSQSILSYGLVALLVGGQSPWVTTAFSIASLRFSARHRTIVPTGTSTRFMSSADTIIDPQEYLERARKLREEIDAFEQKKDTLEQAEQQVTQAELDEKQAFIDAYSVIIPILKPDGNTVAESIFFPPTTIKRDGTDTTPNANSEILVFEIPLPMGILLGQDEETGIIEVDEVAEGSNGQAASVQEGDILRACTACRMEMSQPTWQLVVGGIGQPKTFRFMYGTDGQTLEQSMEAIGSNRMDPLGRSVVLVLERPSQK
jgi:hypothetical protein